MSLAAVGVGLATYAGTTSVGTALAAGAGAYLTAGAGSESSSAITKTKGEGEKLVVDQLVLEEEAIDKIMKDILGQADGGIADILSQENISGIFDTSVAAQASGDLVSKLTGEIAKLTGKQVTATTEKSTKKVTEDEVTDSMASLLADVEGIGDLIADVVSKDIGTESQD